MGQAESSSSNVRSSSTAITPQANSKKERKKEIKRLKNVEKQTRNSSALPPQHPTSSRNSRPHSSRNHSLSSPPRPSSSSSNAPRRSTTSYNQPQPSTRLARAASSPAVTTATRTQSGRFTMKESTLRLTLEEMGFPRAVISEVLESIAPPPEPGCRRSVVDPNTLIEKLMEETRKRFGDQAVAELTNGGAVSSLLDEATSSSSSSSSSSFSTTTPSLENDSNQNSEGNAYVNPFLLPEEEIDRLEAKPCDYQNPFDLGEDNKCKVCLENNIDAVILRCGHLALCMSCSRGLKKCPICRRNITEVVKIFHA